MFLYKPRMKAAGSRDGGASALVLQLFRVCRRSDRLLGWTDGTVSGDKERAIFIPSHSNFRPSQGAQPLAASIHSCIRVGPTLRYALSAIGGEVHGGISPNADKRAGSRTFSDTFLGLKVHCWRRRGPGFHL